MKTKLFLKTIALVGLLGATRVNAQINPTKNIIGVDVSTNPQNASFNYDSCFTLGKNLGMTTVGLFQNWTAIETAANSFNLGLFDIANIYYPAYKMSIDLTITPIHTNNLEVPSDLKTTPFDDPTVIKRFKTLLDSVKVHIPNVSLSSLVIGSEHDVYMGTNANLWAQYTTFYNAVSVYAKTLWPGLKVATELTFTGITTQNTFAQTLNANSDYIGISYYPLHSDFTVKPIASIPADFATLVGLYPSKPLCFYQYGYPSSATCNSSDALQAQFIAQTFSSWDTYANNIRLIDFTWLHDLDTAKVNYYGRYYELNNIAFLEYLHTLGLRTWNGKGTDKAAFRELQCQAKQRGYNNLDVNCPSVLSDLNERDNYIVDVFPNPVQNILNIAVPFEFENADLKIYNQLGQLEKLFLNRNSKQLTIKNLNLKNGLYYIVLQIGEKQINGRFIVNN